MICLICDSNDWDTKGLIQRCRNCGFTRAQEYFFNQKHEQIYSNSYYNNGDYANYKFEKDALIKNFKNRLRKIISYIGSGNLLEIGSAHGYFLELAKKHFKVEGVECNENLAMNLQDKLRVRMHSGQFETLKLNENYYDAIVTLDTIEHVRDPKEFLNNCFKILKKDGYLFIETGDIDRLLPKIQGQKWRLIKPPEHLNYFSKDTLQKLLTQTGFPVVKVEYVTFWRSLSQTIFRTAPKIFKLLPEVFQKNLFRVTFPLYTGDLMFVIAQKQK